jgi:hypothetical protein
LRSDAVLRGDTALGRLNCRRAPTRCGSVGKDNRPRRAVKRSAAKRRGSHQRSGRPAAGSSRAAGTPFSGGGTTDPFTRPDVTPGVEQLCAEQAERSLNRLLGARASGQLLAHLVEQELISLQSAGLCKHMTHLVDVLNLRLRRLLIARHRRWRLEPAVTRLAQNQGRCSEPVRYSEAHATHCPPYVAA